MIKSSITTSVVLCPICLGFGFTTYEEIEDYHKYIITSRKRTCSTCNGLGRLIQKTTVEFNILTEGE